MRINRPFHKICLEKMANAALAISGCLPGAVFYVNMDLPTSQEAANHHLCDHLFRVTQDTASVELDFIIEAHNANGLLQVVDSATHTPIWQREIRDSLVFTQKIGPLKRGRPYALRFAGAAPSRTAITVSSPSDKVKELARPTYARSPAQLAET
ncbi:hypothetical protein [Acutalibacter caecimuris]|uniref:hypothetical protein n=1 Tax=Acutalibacter caecimuris TaxID=3093657 RepID=UPI002AC8CB6E|nr:hypothetical protein [Acutalibacter sp. M00118]